MKQSLKNWSWLKFEDAPFVLNSTFVFHLGFLTLRSRQGKDKDKTSESSHWEEHKTVDHIKADFKNWIHPTVCIFITLQTLKGISKCDSTYSWGAKPVNLTLNLKQDIDIYLDTKSLNVWMRVRLVEYVGLMLGISSFFSGDSFDRQSFFAIG